MHSPVASLQTPPASTPPISLHGKAAPIPPPGCGKSVAPQIPIPLQTPASKPPDCGSRKTPAAEPANNSASRLVHHLCDIQEKFDSSTRTHSAVSTARLHFLFPERK